MEEKITIQLNGIEKEVFLITIVSLEKYQSSYLVYSELSFNDNVNLLSIGKITEEDGKTYLDNLSSEEEQDVKEYLGKEFLNYE